MNIDTVRMCAETTARQQLAALGCIGDDVQELLAELDAAATSTVEEVADPAPDVMAKPAKKTAAK